jgi:hypothetical protein
MVRRNLFSPRFFAATFGSQSIGGSAWDVQTKTGDGITSNQTYTTTGTWEGYVVSADRMSIAVASGVGSLIGEKQWYAVSRTGGLAPKSRLVSQADASLVFEVGAVERILEYVRYLVYPVAVA